APPHLVAAWAAAVLGVSAAGSTGGERWPLLRLGYFPPGRGRGGFVGSPAGGGVLVVGFQVFLLSPPLDKALHDLS
ncbi:hypothetical protein B7D72_21725, partial [Klebsiella pneumoniae]